MYSSVAEKTAHPHNEQDVSRCHIRNIIKILKLVNHVEVTVFSMGHVETNMWLVDNQAHRQIGCAYARVHAYRQIYVVYANVIYGSVYVCEYYLYAYKHVIP